MSRIMCVASVPVKSHRHSARKPGRFGAGVFATFSPSPADSAWAAQAFSEVPEMPDADLDRIAAERAWEDAYENCALVVDHCSLCGLAPDDGALTAGLCTRCSDLIDMGISIVPCRSCGRPTDDEAPYCSRCDTPAADEQGAGSQYLAATGRRMTV